MKESPKQDAKQWEAERAQLSAWLTEWDLDQKLINAVQEEWQPELKVVSGHACNVGDVVASDLQVGSVMLLAPPQAGSVAEEMPLYVLLVELDDSAALLVPFARFHVPAIPEEWSTSFSYAPLQVLCFWNERSVPLERFPDCWQAQTLTPKQLKTCLQARIHILMGRMGKSDRLRGIGPRLLHPGDPRHSYLAEERLRLDQHLGIARAGNPVIEESKTLYLRDSYEFRDTSLLAAEAMTGYGLRGGTYMTEDREAVIATYVEDPNRIRIRIVDREGRLAKQYEGGCLQGVTGIQSERIRQGVAMAHPDLAENLAVLMVPGRDPIRLITTFS